MMTLHTSANLLSDQQIRKYRSDLHSWVGRVRSARRFQDALRIAAQEPTLGSLARALSGTVSSEKSQARRNIEHILIEKFSSLPKDDASLVPYMRMAQGHWPSLYRTIEAEHRARRPE